MEGGAKGQLGGMEMGEEERKRLASESQTWKCQGCGGITNSEILKAEEERCKEINGGQGSVKAAPKDQVPEELRFGFRDEMRNDESSTKGKEKQPLTGAQLGDEGGPATVDKKADARTVLSEDAAFSANVAPSMSAPSATAIAPAQPMQQHPLPSRTTSIPSATDNGVPAWVDKAIVAVVAGLAVMVAKKIAI